MTEAGVVVEPVGPALAPSRRAWLTGRVAVLLVALVAVGAVAGVRVAERLDRPAAGDRYQVSYEGEDGCATVTVRADGLILVGSSDMSRPPLADGKGSLLLDSVWDLSEGEGGDGFGATGVLTLADGRELRLKGGTERVAFLNLSCPIRA